MWKNWLGIIVGVKIWGMYFFIGEKMLVRHGYDIAFIIVNNLLLVAYCFVLHKDLKIHSKMKVPKAVRFLMHLIYALPLLVFIWCNYELYLQLMK